MIDQEDLLARFLTYVQIDTQSDIHSDSTPSTPGQWNLIRKLEGELKALGLSEVQVTEFGFVLGTLPANSKKNKIPRLLFLAHVDTADAASGLAKPIVHRKYDGKPIILPANPEMVLNEKTAKYLSEKIGEDIITASGDSLLGADDKSGIAIIMAALKALVAHPEIQHGPIRVCFNPDEEIGKGTEKITLDELDADVAYTLDSEMPGEVDYESFSAMRAILNIRGVAAHPGWAKGVMVNATRIAAEFIDGLHVEMGPENSSGRMGYIHPNDVKGSSEQTRVEMLVRDFERDGLAQKCEFIEQLVARLAAKNPRAKLELRFEKQYMNMRYWLENDMRPVEYAFEAIRRIGLKPFSDAIRGGTDGSRLTERGLPTPNLFTGFHNVHSELEWVSLQDMRKAAEAVIEVARVWEERA